jgi:hypothetical protein
MPVHHHYYVGIMSSCYDVVSDEMFEWFRQQQALPVRLFFIDNVKANLPIGSSIKQVLGMFKPSSTR